MGKSIFLGTFSVKQEVRLSVLDGESEVKEGNRVKGVRVFNFKLDISINRVHGLENPIGFFAICCKDQYVVNVTLVEAYMEVVHNLALEFRHIDHCQKARDAVSHWEARDLLVNLTPVFEIIVFENTREEFANLSRRERKFDFGTSIQVLFHD